MGGPKPIYVTLNIPGFLYYTFLGWHPPEDHALAIGITMVAFLAEKDPGHVFLPAAAWHDAAYAPGSEVQKEWPRWKADREFNLLCLDISQGVIPLEEEAHTLHLYVRKFYHGTSWQGAGP